MGPNLGARCESLQARNGEQENHEEKGIRGHEKLSPKLDRGKIKSRVTGTKKPLNF